MKTWIVIAGAFLLVGCATLTTGTTQAVSVDVLNAKGASCEGTDKAGRKYHWPKTPAVTTVQKGDGPIQLVCTLEGFKQTLFSFDETFVAATLGNVILGGGVGLFVDIASGAAQEYSSTIKLVMEPVDSASVSEQEKYKRLKMMLEEERKKQEEETEKEIHDAANR